MFPSFSDLQFLHSMGVLMPNQVQMYLNGGAIDAAQAKELGFVEPQATVAPASSASSASASSNTQQARPAKASVSSTGIQQPNIKPNVTPTVNTANK